MQQKYAADIDFIVKKAPPFWKCAIKMSRAISDLNFIKE
ncbi:hypothetical protein BTJ45_02207 [Bacillus mycoides]|nr:hypothetical protein BTJ45_02207 [Bacillus mycoides]